MADNLITVEMLIEHYRRIFPDATEGSIAAAAQIDVAASKFAFENLDPPPDDK